MKRKTSQKALSSQTLSARLEAWKRSNLSRLVYRYPAVVLLRYNFLYRLRVFIDHFMLITLSIWCLLFLSSSYLVKFLGTLTRVVRLATRP